MSPHNLSNIRVVLVGSQRVMLDPLGSLIDTEPDLTVLSEGVATIRLPGAASREQPDIALFDLDDVCDVDLLFEHLAKTAAACRTIVLTMSSNPEVWLRAFQSGALGLVSKLHPPALLFKAIRKVHAGEAWLGREMTAQLLDVARADCQRLAQRAGMGPTLSARDRELITLVGDGRSNAEIARRLLASEATVRAGLTSLFRKVGASCRFDLIAYAYRHGLLRGAASSARAALIQPTPGRASPAWGVGTNAALAADELSSPPETPEVES